MSQFEVKSGFARRPSFWKTPITRNPLQSISKKRNYSQLSNNPNDNHNQNSINDSFLNPKKKRRLLSHSEIENIAKCGGFNPSNILIAVQESDGFCWFKRAIKPDHNKQQYLQKYAHLNTAQNEKDQEKEQKKEQKPEEKSNDKQESESTENVLREISKEELKQRQKSKKSINPNEINRQKAKRAIEKARRHTLPIHILQKLIDSNNEKEKELLGNKNKNKNAIKNKKKKRRKKKKKTITRYENKEQIVKKKVIKKKRIVYKKKTQTKTIKIITEFASINIPDFPIPNLKLSTIFYSELNKPLIAIHDFELGLIESFAISLNNIYGQIVQFSFISRNVIQCLMEIKNNLNNIINCIDFDVVNVHIKDSIICYQEFKEKNKNKDKEKSAKLDENKNRKIKTPKNENEINIKQNNIEIIQANECLNDEYKFYENQYLILDEFCKKIEEEIDFTNNAQKQLQNEQYLANIFDFESMDNDNNQCVNNKDNNSILNDNNFLNEIASEIDKIYAEYGIDFHKIEYEQDRFEKELNERECQYLRKYKESKQDKNGHDNNNNINNDKLMISNFIASNKDNDYFEDQLDSPHYLRNLDGYDLNEDDTLNFNVLKR